MTARREVPISGDSLGWVHNEVSDLKRKVAQAQQAAEQSRLQAAEATSAAQLLQDQMEAVRSDGALQDQIQDAVITLHERLGLVEEDIQALRHSRDEAQRHAVQIGEKQNQGANEATRAIAELDRKLEILLERVSNEETLGRRNLEASAHLEKRLAVLEGRTAEEENWRSRTASTLSRIDQDLQRTTSQLAQVAQDGTEQRERTNTAMENLRRVSAEVEGAHSFLVRVREIDDRLELVQAERTRHNERINELAQSLEGVAGEQAQQRERSTLVETRMAGYQDELGRLREGLQAKWDGLAMHLRALSDTRAELRKRQINALEKEIRDIRSQSFDAGRQ